RHGRLWKSGNPSIKAGKLRSLRRWVTGGFVGCACAPVLCPGYVGRGARPTKSDHTTSAHWCRGDPCDRPRGGVATEFVGCACAPILCPGYVGRGAHPTSFAPTQANPLDRQTTSRPT